MKKKFMAGLLALAVCLIVVSGAYAFGGFGRGLQGNKAVQQALESNDYGAFVEAIASSVSEQEFQAMTERHQAGAVIQQALADRDYKAWVEAVESMPRITDVITEENFPKYAAMHEAMQEGDFEAVREISEELGLNQFGKGFGFHAGPYAVMRHGMGHGFRNRFFAGEAP